MSGLAGDHSKRCAWDLARFVSLDAELKQKEVIVLLAGGVGWRIGSMRLNWRFFRAWYVAILRYAGGGAGEPLEGVGLNLWEP